MQVYFDFSPSVTGGDNTLTNVGSPVIGGLTLGGDAGITLETGMLAQYSFTLESSNTGNVAVWYNRQSNGTQRVATLTSARSGSSTPADMQVAFDNSNVAGITDTSANATAAAMVSTGYVAMVCVFATDDLDSVELTLSLIPFVTLPTSATSINIVAFISNDPGSTLSNQFIGSLPVVSVVRKSAVCDFAIAGFSQ
jgi:hypothetical protein